MTWTVMLLAMAGTLLVRVPVTVVASSWTPAPWLAARLAALAPAAATALLVTMLFRPGGSPAVPGAAELAAVAVTAAVMRRTSVLALALGAGLAVFLVLP